MKDALNGVKHQILRALEHSEAEEGLYFRNFTLLHEEDQRPAVLADEVQILDALKELIQEGKVRMDDSGKEVIFFLNGAAKG